MLNFTANAKNLGNLEEEVDRENNFIRIRNSVFKNIGFQQVI